MAGNGAKCYAMKQKCLLVPSTTNSASISQLFTTHHLPTTPIAMTAASAASNIPVRPPSPPLIPKAQAQKVCLVSLLIKHLIKPVHG
jgi:hypothetical protein